MIKHRIRISGTVQGVGYRLFAAAAAQALGIAGRVWNEADGSVMAEAMGQKAALQTWEKKLRRGPYLARVKQMEVTAGTFADYENFTIG